MKDLTGQKIFNFIISLAVLAIGTHLIWLNWRGLQSAPMSLSVAAPTLTQPATEAAVPVSPENACDRDCVKAIVSEQLAQITAVPTPTNAQVPKSVTAKPTAQAKQTSFVNLAGGTAGATDWVQVDDNFWLDTALYGETVIANWEGRLSIQDGNGVGFARLYDMTNNRGVDGSQVEVSGTETISFYSGNLALWRGQNQYRIEVRSTSSYPITVSAARIKLVY